MTDIVERLLDRAYSFKAKDPLCEEAAKEIERLRRKLASIERFAETGNMFEAMFGTPVSRAGQRGTKTQNSDVNCPERDNTTQGSVQGEGSFRDSRNANEPAAWAVIGKERLSGHVFGLHDTAMEAHARVGRMVSYGEIITADKVEVVPLFRQPPDWAFLNDEIARLRDAIRRLAGQDATLSVCDGNVTVTMDATLTDAEREAVEVAIRNVDWRTAQRHTHAAILRGLLERLK